MSLNPEIWIHCGSRRLWLGGRQQPSAARRRDRTRLRNEAPAHRHRRCRGESRRQQQLPAATVSSWVRRYGPPGSREQGMSTEVPQEPGRPGRLRRQRAAVPLSEGTTRAKRDGRSGVGAPHCTGEAGTAAQATLRRDGGAGSRNRWRELWRRDRAPEPYQRNLNG